MNGHNIDGTGATKNNGRVLLMTTKSSSEKPIEGKEPFFRITNSQSDGGKITGKLPFETSCGNGKDTVPVIIDENVKLITTEEGTNAVKLQLQLKAVLLQVQVQTKTEKKSLL